MEHLITPPDELVQQLWSQCPAESDNLLIQFATLMSRWGADAELEACCAWVEREIGHGREWGEELRAVRRPKPPSLAEQALEVVTSLRLGECVHRNGAEMDVLTAALERLKELEKGNE